MGWQMQARALGNLGLVEPGQRGGYQVCLRPPVSKVKSQSMCQLQFEGN